MTAPAAQPADPTEWLAAGSDPTSAFVTVHPPAGFAEAFVAPKSTTDPCEDVLVLTPHFVAVIDGMSSPLRRHNHRRSGRDYAMATGEAISQLPQKIDARGAVDMITERLVDIAPSHLGPAGCVAAIYSVHRREIWRIGDIHVAIGSRVLPAVKEVDTALATFRAAINAANIAAGTPLHVIQTADPGLRAARPLLEIQPSLANRGVPYGYGVLNGTPVPDVLIETYPVPERCWITIATDGYLAPRPSLAEAEEQLHAAAKADPACIGPMRDMGKALKPGADAPDDRAYVRFHVERHENG